MATIRDDQTRKPADIEQDIERTRSQMASTLANIQKRLSPGQMLDQTLGYFENKSGNLAANMGRTVKENPVPATLIGLGLAWLFTSNRTSGAKPSQSAASTAGGSYGGPARQGENPGSPRESGNPGFEPVGERRLAERRISGRAGGGGMGRTVPHPDEPVREAAGRAGEKIEETVSGIGESAGGLMSHTRENVEHAVSQAREKTRQVAERASRQAHQVGDQVQHLAEERPLLLAAVGVAIGAALGAVLPKTRTESQWLGETRNRLVERAGQAGGEMLHEARRQIHSAGQTRPDVADPERTEGLQIAGSASGKRDIAEEAGGMSGAPGESERGMGTGSRVSEWEIR
jgi:ElaB/YqjD/DUF883 family membrane-anchored ribosome-binding protein